MTADCSIVAHVIVGPKTERYLDAVLESVADVCDHVVINDNSGSEISENTTIAQRSRVGCEGKLTVVNTAFAGFAAARNACIEATPARYRSGWGMMLDADEVHGPDLAVMAGVLPSLPPDIDAVDGYCRHFVGSFAWWYALERHRCFFRLAPERRWRGEIHERLDPVRHQIALPAVWHHYGHVIEPQEEVEKSIFYSGLGGGEAPDPSVLPTVTPHMVWSKLLVRASRFEGDYPPAVRSVIERLGDERAAIFQAVDEIATKEQSTADRVRNALYRGNIARLLAWRRLAARWRWHWREDERAQNGYAA